MHDVKPGMIVRHSTDFCKAIQWHTPPLSGIVIRVHERLAFGNRRVSVWWCDEIAGVSREILASNLELCPSDRTVSDTMRQILIDEFEDAEKTNVE